MSTQEDEFLQSLRVTFRVEADEHLQAIAAGLLALEKSLSPEERRRRVETVFRAAHSLHELGQKLKRMVEQYQV